MATRKRTKSSTDSSETAKKQRTNINDALAAFEPKATRSSTRARQSEAKTEAKTDAPKPKPLKPRKSGPSNNASSKNSSPENGPSTNPLRNTTTKDSPAKRFQSKPPTSIANSDTKELTSYQQSLVHGAPAPDNSRTKKVLSSFEYNFLDDVDTLAPMPQVGTVSHAKNESDKFDVEVCPTQSEIGSEDEEDGPDEEEHMLVEDITRPEKKKRTSRRTGKAKVLQVDFENPELARFAKRCARMGTCIINMYPHRDPMFAWKLFSSQLNKLVEDGTNEDLLESFLALSRDGRERKKLVTFMNYGPSQIRWEIASHIRIRVGQFFGIPGSMSEDTIIVAVNWLVKSRSYHHGEVDLMTQTCDSKPFTSPLMGLILRGYFIDSNPDQDQVLVDYLRELRRIPVRLIAMITALIGHAVQEYTLGAKSRTDIPLTFKNLSPHYNQIVDTLAKIQEEAPDYIEYLETSLYMEMMNTGAEALPIQVYNYKQLNAFALAEKHKKSQLTDVAPLPVSSLTYSASAVPSEHAIQGKLKGKEAGELNNSGAVSEDAEG